MTRLNKQKYPPPIYDFGSGSGTYMWHELFQSDAYKVLTFAEKAVFRDMYRVFSAATQGNKRRIDTEGFKYTFAHCWENVSSHTFYDAIGRILGVGFFKRADELKSMRSGSPNVYMPSPAWRVYKPTPEEAKKLRRFELSKRTKIAQDKNRRTEFLSSLSRNPKTESNGKSHTDIRGKKLHGQESTEELDVGKKLTENPP